VVQMLEDLGYDIVEAGDGPEALEVLAGKPDISLLFTDVMLPNGMSGPEMARKAREILPDLKVLFTSGYTDNYLADHGKLGEDFELLKKPYKKPVLAQKIRDALDAKA